MSSPVRVASLGRFARAALVAGDARVIAVFERSAYVETPAGLACVGAVGNGPLNAQCGTLPTGLRVGDSLRFEIAGASLWRPRPAPTCNVETIARSLDHLRVAARDRLPAEGFGYLLNSELERPVTIQALTRWIGEPSGTLKDTASLIGLGPGLTPSGDDLIGGVLCALHASGRVEIAVRLAEWAVPLARTGTNRISYGHLTCAAAGECGEAVNDAIVAIFVGDPPDLERIDATGHTSGWDALAGVVLGLAKTTEATAHS